MTPRLMTAPYADPCAGQAYESINGLCLMPSSSGGQGVGMPFLPLPTSAAWLHQAARSGFEVVYIELLDRGHLLTGVTAAIEGGQPWIVDYEILVDADWRTRSAQLTGRSDAGLRTRLLESDGQGRWRIDDEVAPHLDGCLDVDLESSALTNALPVHRLALTIGATAKAPAVYVRALGLSVERLEPVHTHQRSRWAPVLRLRRSIVRLLLPVDLRRDWPGAAYPGIAT